MKIMKVKVKASMYEATMCVCLHQGSQANRCTLQVLIDYEPVETWREEEEEWREEEDWRRSELVPFEEETA